MASKKQKNSAKANTLGETYVGSKEFQMYCFAGFGQGMVYAVMSSYISDYYTNVMKLPLVFVMLLMLLARVWDAVNDPMMGMIADRVTTPWGKMKPYMLMTAAPILILTCLMFFTPNFSGGKLMVYAAVVYVAWGMIYTMSDVPFSSIPNVMTPNPGERNRLISVGRTYNGVGSAIPTVIFMVLGMVLPGIAAKMSTSSNGLTLKIFNKFTEIAADGTINVDKLKYFSIALVCSVIGMILFALGYPFIKERVVIPYKKAEKAKGEKSQLGRLFSCKPLMCVVIMGILSSGRYMLQAASVHVARYAVYMGPELAGLDAAAKTEAVQKSISTVSTIFQACSAIGMFGAMLLMPMLLKRFESKNLIVKTALFGFAASVITSVAGYFAVAGKISFFVCIPFIVISSIPLGVINIASYAMIADSLDFMEWETGFRDTGLASACQGFINKLGNALATTGVIVMYLAIGLNPSAMLEKTAAIDISTLPILTRYGMFSLVSIIPGLSLILCTIPLKFYDLVGDKKQKITNELAERRKANGISFEQ